MISKTKQRKSTYGVSVFFSPFLFCNFGSILKEVSLTILATTLLSACSVSLFCPDEEKLSSDRTTKYTLTATIIADNDYQETKSVSFSCTTGEPKCTENGWYNTYQTNPEGSLLFNYSPTHSLKLNIPVCSAASYAPIVYSGGHTSGMAKIISGGESHAVLEVDLKKPTAISVFGVGLESYNVTISQ